MKVKNVSLLLVILCVAIVAPVTAFADLAWYVGQVNRIALIGADGSFVVTLKSDALNDCQYKYAYFNGSHLGEGRLRHAYSMALTSLSTGVDMGIVIDKAINGVDGQCDATGMTADLRAK